MSSFMCCPETIYDVARCVVYMGMTQERYLGNDKSWSEVFNIERRDDRKTKINKIYKKLINLNILALKERYLAYEDEIGDIDRYDRPLVNTEFRPEYKIAMEVSCFIYQCSEGKASYTDEYDIVVECYDILCRDLVCMECRNREAELSRYWI